MTKQDIFVLLCLFHRETYSKDTNSFTLHVFTDFHFPSYFNNIPRFAFRQKQNALNTLLSEGLSVGIKM